MTKKNGVVLSLRYCRKRLLFVAFLLMFMGIIGMGFPVTSMQVQAISEEHTIIKVKALNPLTLQVTFSHALPQADLSLEASKANFRFSDGMSIRNVPQLMTGSTATYLLPTTLQQAGKRYTLNFKRNNPISFQGSGEKIQLGILRQVSYDTFEINTDIKTHVVDYSYVVSSQAGIHRDLDFALDENNVYEGHEYQIIPSLRNISVTIVPERGVKIRANYVPYTQTTDDRQSPKFRLVNGSQLRSGVRYRVESDWGLLAENAFRATKMQPLLIERVVEVNPTTIQIALNKDPKDEVFSSRSVQLMDNKGNRLVAAYKFQSRVGGTGTFTIQHGKKLQAKTKYYVFPIGQWSITPHVTLITK